MKNKVAFITGAAKGLGKAFAEILLENGAKVCICDINQEVGTQTKIFLQNKYTKDRVYFVKCDVTVEEEVENALKGVIARYGGLDILCNNAGIINEKNWKLMLDINLTAVLQNTVLGCKYMGKSGGRPNGVIINVASSAGVMPHPFGPFYCAFKHGVVGFSRSLGLLSQRTFGVRINCLCPTFANTDLMEWNAESVYNSEDVNSKFSIQRLRKLANELGIMETREVAESFLKLVQDDTLSGQVMLVTPQAKGILSLPITIPDVFDTYNSKL